MPRVRMSAKLTTLVDMVLSAVWEGECDGLGGEIGGDSGLEEEVILLTEMKEGSVIQKCQWRMAHVGIGLRTKLRTYVFRKKVYCIHGTWHHVLAVTG